MPAVRPSGQRTVVVWTDREIRIERFDDIRDDMARVKVVDIQIALGVDIESDSYDEDEGWVILEGHPLVTVAHDTITPGGRRRTRTQTP